MACKEHYNVHRLHSTSLASWFLRSLSTKIDLHIGMEDRGGGGYVKEGGSLCSTLVE